MDFQELGYFLKTPNLKIVTVVNLISRNKHRNQISYTVQINANKKNANL